MTLQFPLFIVCSCLCSRTNRILTRIEREEKQKIKYSLNLPARISPLRCVLLKLNFMHSLFTT
jgi:hypothetical protein